MLVIWSRSLLLLLFWGKSSSGNEAMRVLYYIWYIFGIGKNWFDIETTIQRMYIRCVRPAFYFHHLQSYTKTCTMAWMKYWQSIFYLFPLYLLCVVGRLLPRLRGIDMYVCIFILLRSHLYFTYKYYLLYYYLNWRTYAEKRLYKDSNDSLYIFKAIKD